MSSIRYGQHFLHNQALVRRIIEYANITKEDTILEVGPGKGVLTRSLASHAKAVTCIEIDKHLVEQSSLWIEENIHMIQGDALTLDLTTIPRWNKCVSNLPYDISSPFLFHLLKYRFQLAILMFQKDFALRLVASPGTKQYSRLTVHVYYHARCELLEHVPKTQFHPRPKVDSELVKIIPRDEPPFHVQDEHLFFRITTQLFNHRRKTIANGLNSILGQQAKNLSMAKKRVEQLTPEEIGQLSNEVLGLLEHHQQ